MKKIMMVLLLLGSNIASAKESIDLEQSRYQEIVTIEDLRIKALLENNITIFTKIMHPDAVHISSNGNRATTSQWLTNRKNSTQPFATFILNDDRIIRFFENFAIVDGTYSNSKLINGKQTPLKHARYTRVYKEIKENIWQMISHQATEIKK